MIWTNEKLMQNFLYLPGSACVTLASLCENNYNKSSGFIEGGGFLNCIRDCQLVKENSATWNYPLAYSNTTQYKQTYSGSITQ
jgi:hypothetical protein